MQSARVTQGNKMGQNQSMGFEIPYQLGGIAKKHTRFYCFGCGMGDNLLNLISEVKGYRGEDAKEKKILWMHTGYQRNNLKKFGRWGFAEFRDP